MVCTTVVELGSNYTILLKSRAAIPDIGLDRNEIMGSGLFEILLASDAYHEKVTSDLFCVICLSLYG